MTEAAKKPQFFSVVYKNITPGAEALELGSHEKASALAWGHLMDESHQFEADAKAAQAECREQARLLGISAERELALHAKLAHEKLRADQMEQRWKEKTQEVVELRHDIARHVAICAEQATRRLSAEEVDVVTVKQFGEMPKTHLAKHRAYARAIETALGFKDE